MKFDATSLTMLLAKSIKNDKIMCLNVGATETVDRVLRGNDLIQFLWLKKIDKPIFQFWRLFKEKKLAHNCHVVFTDIEESDPGWLDLENAFGGTKFGTLFLMRVSEHAKPPILPSQSGLYKK